MSTNWSRQSAVSAQARRMPLEVVLQRGLVAQAVVRADRDAAGRGRRIDHVGQARVDEAGQGEDFLDVRAQPRAILGLDRRIEVDVDLVNHLAHIATRPIAMLAKIAKLSRIV